METQILISESCEEKYERSKHAVGVSMWHFEWCTKYRLKMFRKESQKGPSPLVPKRIDIGTGFFAFVQSSGKWHFVKEH